MKRKLLFLVFALVIGTAIQSCRESGLNPWEKPIDEVPLDEGNNLPVEKLVGTVWRLTLIEKKDKGEVLTVPQDDIITLGFASDTKVSGQAICNNFGAIVKSEKVGYISFSDLIVSDAFCGGGKLDVEFIAGIRNAVSYNASEKELRINYTPEAPGSGNCTLVFMRANNSNEGEYEYRAKLIEQHTYTLYAFENGDAIELLPGSEKCTIKFNPSKNTANITAICNSGEVGFFLNKDATEMYLTNVNTVFKTPCENQNTADAFLQFFQHAGKFEYSDYGSKLTIWSSLPTLSARKIILKVNPTILLDIPLQETPSTGVPADTYPITTITDLKFDENLGNGRILLKYTYNGQTDDFYISAYSKFEFDVTDPATIIIDLVGNGSPNTSSIISQGEVAISLDQLRARVTTSGSQLTAMKAIVRYQGQELAELKLKL